MISSWCLTLLEEFDLAQSVFSLLRASLLRPEILSLPRQYLISFFNFLDHHPLLPVPIIYAKCGLCVRSSRIVPNPK